MNLLNINNTYSLQTYLYTIFFRNILNYSLILKKKGGNELDMNCALLESLEDSNTTCLDPGERNNNIMLQDHETLRHLNL